MFYSYSCFYLCGLFSQIFGQKVVPFLGNVLPFLLPSYVLSNSGGKEEDGDINRSLSTLLIFRSLFCDLKLCVKVCTFQNLKLSRNTIVQSNFVYNANMRTFCIIATEILLICFYINPAYSQV